jgi:tetratricopeptide (TPR) repeat protein
LAEAAEPKLYGPELLLWLDRLEQEHDNLRAALRWTIELHETDLALRLGAALGWFWFVRGYEREGLQWLEAALTQSSTDRTLARAWALWHASQLAGPIGDRGRARTEESLVLFRELGDKRGTARALGSLGFLIFLQGNTERAVALFAEHMALAQALGDAASLADAMNSRQMLAQLRGDDGAQLPLAVEHVALRRQVGDPQSLCWSLNVLGEVARLVGDDRAIAAYEEALALARALSSRGFVASILANLGFVVQRQGNHGRAAMLFGESLAAARELAAQDMMTLALTGLAGVMTAQSQPQRAARLLAAVEAWWVMNNAQMEPADRADYDRIVADARAQLGEEAFAAAWEAGRAMTLEQAIAEALGR